MTFKNSEEALRHCDKYKSCKGVAIEGDTLHAVDSISKEPRKLKLISLLI